MPRELGAVKKKLGVKSMKKIADLKAEIPTMSKDDGFKDDLATLR